MVEETRVNDNVTIDEPTEEQAQRGAEAARKTRSRAMPKFDPDEAADSLKSGVMRLKEPIWDGDREYTELEYDFTLLKGLELARALDFGDIVPFIKKLDEIFEEPEIMFDWKDARRGRRHRQEVPPAHRRRGAARRLP